MHKRIFLAIFLFLFFINSISIVNAQDFTITCDKNTYYCLKNCEAVCDITNNLNHAIRVNVSAVFDNFGIIPRDIYVRETQTIEKTRNTYEVSEFYVSCSNVTDYGNGTTECDGYPYYDVSYNSTHIWYNESQVNGTYVEQITQYVWTPFTKKWLILQPLRKIKGEKNFTEFNTETVKIVFDVPKRSYGKFNVTIIDENNMELGVLDPWWNSSWTKRRAISINSTQNLTNYQVKLVIQHDNDIRTDFGDLRFTYYNSTDSSEYEIPYWIENKTDGVSAWVWVKVPFISASNNTIIYMYYGNPNATTTSNGYATFIHFDDFSTWNSTNWDDYANNTFIIQDGKVIVYYYGNLIKAGLYPPFTIRAKSVTYPPYYKHTIIIKDDYNYDHEIGSEPLTNSYYTIRGTNNVGGTIYQVATSKPLGKEGIFEIKVKSNNSYQFYVDENYVTTRTESLTPPLGYGIEVAEPSQTGNVTTDYMLLRAYADNEPDYQIGSEENVTISLSVTFNYNSVNFGNLNHNTTDNPAPNQLSGVYNVTVSSPTNYKVEVNGTDFSDGTFSFSVSNLKMNTNSTSSNLNVNNAITLSGTPQVIETNIPSSVVTHYHGYWLTIPSGQYASTYSNTITITYSVV